LIDLDGVLRLWDPEYFSVAERAAGLPHGTIRPTVFAPELLVPAITGRTSDQTWRRLARDTLQARFPGANAQLAIDLWSESAGTVDQSVLDLVRQCRKVAKVGLVTNATTRLQSDLARLPLLDEFDLIVNSSAVGCVKPEPWHL
jgi:putative hydrolase of the HAD superfamily